MLINKKKKYVQNNMILRVHKVRSLIQVPLMVFDFVEIFPDTRLPIAEIIKFELVK